MTWVRSVPLFRELDDDEVAAVERIAARKLFQRGEVVVREGAEADAAYVVVLGRLKITVAAADKDAAIGVLGPGDVFGELGLLGGGLRTATVSALEPTQLIVLGGEGFHGLLRRAPSVTYKVLRHVGRRLVQLTEHVEATRTPDVGARLAHQLAELARAHGEKAAGGTRIALRLSQSDLAAMIGATRESVNKHLRTLAPNVTHQRGELVIRDVSALGSPRARTTSRRR